jgi:hypothetical protein
VSDASKPQLFLFGMKAAACSSHWALFGLAIDVALSSRGFAAISHKITEHAFCVTVSACFWCPGL